MLILAAVTGAGILSVAQAQTAPQPQPVAPPMTSMLPGQPCGLHPIMATHTIPPYPELSRRLFEQGRVVLLVTISQQGIPTGVTVNTSSGADRLDAAATAWVAQTWRWAPLGSDCPGGARTLVMIMFRLVDNTAPPPVALTIDVPDADYPGGAKDRNESGVANVLVELDEKGEVAATHITHTTTFDDLDAQALALIRRHRFQAALIDGKPVSSALWIVVRFGPAP